MTLHVEAVLKIYLLYQMVRICKNCSGKIFGRFRWLETHLKKCYEALLSIPWILDLDATIKPLYGKQEGADVGYNPKKPGRPAHIYHSYFIANIRFALNVDVQSGKKISGCYSMPGLWKLLESIPKDQWPQFIRGDISYGTERIMRESELRDVKYLFKLKCSSKIKALISRWRETILYCHPKCSKAKASKHLPSSRHCEPALFAGEAIQKLARYTFFIIMNDINLTTVDSYFQ